MLHSVSAFIGLRYLRGGSDDKFSRFVSYMSTAGISIGVMSLVTVLSVMNGFEDRLKNRILGVLPQAVISQNNGKTDVTPLPPKFVSQFSSIQAPEPIVKGEAIIQSADQISAGIIIGIDPSSSDPISRYLIAGKLVNLEAGKYRVFLGHSLARAMGISVGESVRLMVTGASQYTPLGRIPSQRLFKVAGIYNTGSDIDGQLMVTHIQDAGRLMGFSSKTISGWRLFFEDPFSVSELSKKTLPEGWKWQDWRAERGELFQAVKMEKHMMGLMLGLIIAVAAFNIISALIMVVMEKQSEIAILKTQGMSNHQVLAIFMFQGASSGIFGAVIGGMLGVVLSFSLNSILAFFDIDLFSSGEQLPIHYEPVQIFIVIILAVLLSLAATFFPSIRASSVKPAEALRYE